MKMAKASERDIDAAGELMQILEAIDARFGGPWPTDGPESLEKAIGEENFDADKHEHLQGLYNSMAALLRRAPNFHGRVIGGMCYVILYDKNEIVDPEADTLELHPKLQKALEDSEKVAQLQQRIAEMEADAERFKCLVETSPRALCFLGKDYYSVDEFRKAIDDHIASTITEGDKNERN